MMLMQPWVLGLFHLCPRVMRAIGSGLHMLFLAGLMGLITVGAAAFIDIGVEEEESAIDEDAPAGDVISGTPRDDLIIGSGGSDQIAGYGGDDLVEARNGDDTVFGDSGDDTLKGGAGNDDLHGNDGDDLLTGAEDADGLTGHNDDDILQGGAGHDTLNGSAGGDTLFGDSGDDAVMGGLGDDLLIGGRGQDALFGGWGNDTLDGTVDPDRQDARVNDIDEGDYLNGGGGDDVILAGINDTVTPGAGRDDVILGDWVSPDGIVDIRSFDIEDDSLLLVWDDSDAAATAPKVAVEPDPEDLRSHLISMDGAIVAIVQSDQLLMPGDLSLIPLSSALAAGLTRG